MLNRLLDLLREGSARRIEDLARELDTTPGLVEAMLEDLDRMGYVKRVSAQCSDACAECHLSSMCAAGGGSFDASRGQLWVLVDKQEE
jgi:DNA-binding Lrp family transcriptional regulator